MLRKLAILKYVKIILSVVDHGNFYQPYVSNKVYKCFVVRTLLNILHIHQIIDS